MMITSAFIDSYAIDDWGATNAAYMVTPSLIFAGIPKYSTLAVTDGFRN